MVYALYLLLEFVKYINSNVCILGMNSEEQQSPTSNNSAAEADESEGSYRTSV